MSERVFLKQWKKVLEGDLPGVSTEIKREIKKPALIILEGPLGAGKTTLTKSFINNEVFSPTYSLINEVDRNVHADFYRLKNPEEITHLELEYYFEDKDYILIEWGYGYLNEIVRYIDKKFSFYLLNIEIENNFRKITLYTLKL